MLKKLFCVATFMLLPIFVLAAPRPLIIDTDLAEDDWEAMAYLIAQPNVDIKLISIANTGETLCKIGYPQVLTFLAHTEHENIPVSCGPKDPLQGHAHFAKPWVDALKSFFDIQISDYVWKHKLQYNAPESIIKALKASKTPVSILAIGPVTNIALAYQKNPSLFRKKVAGIWFTGGGFDVHHVYMQQYFPKTASLHASWNFYVDPKAIDIVAHSGVPLYFVSDDAQHSVSLVPIYHQLKGREILPWRAWFVRRIFEHTVESNWVVADQVTAVLWMHPGMCHWQTEHVNFLLTPVTKQGQMLRDPHGVAVKMCFKVNQKQFQQAYWKGII